jgi:deoxyribodipyrimidine photolyase
MRVVALVRRELRLTDNPLWQHADGRHEIIPLFVLDDFNQREHSDNLWALFFFALRSLRERIAQHGGRMFCIHTSQQEAFFATVKPDLVLFCEDHEPHSQEQEIDNANKANHATNFSLQVDGATKTKPCYGLQPVVDDGKLEHPT